MEFRSPSRRATRLRPPSVVAVVVVLVFLSTTTTTTATRRTTRQQQQRSSSSAAAAKSTSAKYASINEMRSLLTSRPRLYHHLTSSTRPRHLLRQDQPQYQQPNNDPSSLSSLSTNQNHNLNLNQRTASTSYSFSPPPSSNNQPQALITYGPDDDLTPEGYTLDPCYYHRDCQPEYLCIRGDWGSSCSGSSNCFCLASATQVQCKSCLDCQLYPLETCVRLPDDTSTKKRDNICVSMFVVFEGYTVEVGCDTFPDRDPLTSPYELENVTGGVTGPYGPDNNNVGGSSVSPSPPQQGAGGEGEGRQPSSSISESSIPTFSVTPVSSQTPSASPSSGPLLANDDSDNSGTGNDGNEKEDSNVCIDAAIVVKQVPKDRHVYSQHIRASVLCDARGSCATPAHMVIWQGKAMTMRQYCSEVEDEEGCRRQVMYVNSPKYERRLRLMSNSDGLMFTAFAATFESRLEQATLSVLIHIGL